MRIDAKGYSFELPDKWAGFVAARRVRGGVTLKFLPDAGPEHSGVLATLKAVKRPELIKGDNERLGLLTDSSGDVRVLVAVFGREGACSEDNADFYWRLFDRLPLVYKTVRPQDGFSWQPF